MGRKKRSRDVLDIDVLKEFDFPEPSFFQPPKKIVKKQNRVKFKTNKRKKAYDAFVRWSATPKSLREPKTQAEFERVWKLPIGTVASSFKTREDFHQKRMTHFWNWVFDKYPDVIHAVYRRAIQNSTADAKIFSELVSKRLETTSPTKPRMTPFMLVGVPQSKINALFTPEGVEEAEVIDGQPND
jgi:hypothetical protein